MTPSLTILLAEDEPANQLLFRTVLERAGHRAVVVGDGIAAVAAAERGGLDLVLMDLGLPGMGGLEAARRIRGFDPATPILALTAEDDLDAACRLAGMRGVIRKPIGPADLLAAIQAASPATV